MRGFEHFLRVNYRLSTKKVPFYLNWTCQCYDFIGKRLDNTLTSDEIEKFVSYLSTVKESWQVEQAKEAVNIYIFFKNRIKYNQNDCANHLSQWKIVYEDMTKMLRLRHTSLATERTYLQWVRSFRRYIKNVSPSNLENTHVKAFLSHIAVDRKVSAQRSFAFCSGGE